MPRPQRDDRDEESVEPLRLIDLFAGAGGLTLGFTWHGFVPVWANDNCEDAAATYRANFGCDCVVGDILAALDNPETVVPEADVVVGGPPCQGFSLLNKDREGDPRRHLWMPFLEVVRRAGASAFVMENVPQLLDSVEKDRIFEASHTMGFAIGSAKLCAADYGVPQNRTRAFIVGSRVNDPAGGFPPPRTHYNTREKVRSLLDYIPDPLPWRTLRDAVGDLEPPYGTGIRKVPPPYNLHFHRSPTAISIARYKAIPGRA